MARPKFKPGDMVATYDGRYGVVVGIPSSMTPPHYSLHMFEPHDNIYRGVARYTEDEIRPANKIHELLYAKLPDRN